MNSLQDRIKRYIEQSGLSDIHIHADCIPALRINGEIIVLKEMPVVSTEIEDFTDCYLSRSQIQQWHTDKCLDTDIEIDTWRFRANFYFSDGKPAIALRVIACQAPTMQALNIPESVNHYLSADSGLILIVGATGSGKSTSLAAMANHILVARAVHLITIEDPVEFKLTSEHSVISQRQIGKDAACFVSALHSALREDPDVIVIGEVRDAKTISLMLTAAELGHLVMATLHAPDCAAAVARIINSVPPQYRGNVCAQLADCLNLIMSQRLQQHDTAGRRAAAYEVMTATDAVRNLIRTSKISQLQSVMETSQAQGMVTMDRAVNKLQSISVSSGNGI